VLRARHWQLQQTDFAYKNKGNNAALAAPTRQYTYCVQNRGKIEALATPAHQYCVQKQGQHWGSDSDSSPILRTKTEATVRHWQPQLTNIAYKTETKVRHWQHQLTNIAYKNRGKSAALAAPAHQYCVQNRDKSEALTTPAHQYCVQKQRQQCGTGSPSSPKTETTLGHWLRQLTNIA